MKPILTPRELAEAIGVSESSVKRWVDAGTITATRTAGGHRRIAIGEAVRFIRAQQSVVERPDALGLADVASVGAVFPDRGDEGARLYDYLVEGASPEAKGLLLALYLSGMSVAEIVDGPLHDSMRTLGELWEHRTDGIFREHRATEIAFQAMNRLRALLPDDACGPIAVGGAAPGDIYQLPTLCAATVLQAAGLTAVNLGARLPVRSLETAVDQLGANLVWVSATGLDLPAGTGDDLRLLARRLAGGKVPIVVGGQRVDALGLRSEGNLRVGRTMGELEALVQGMHFPGATWPPN
jgi:excisionase family DNA binding protein